MSNITCFTCGQKYSTVNITNMYVQVTTCIISNKPWTL